MMANEEYYKIENLDPTGEKPIALEQISTKLPPFWYLRNTTAIDEIFSLNDGCMAVCFWYEKGKRPNFPYAAVRNPNVK